VAGEAATAWARANWGRNNLCQPNTGASASFSIPSEISGLLYFRDLTDAACRVLGWDTGPGTPANLTQNAYTAAGVGFELYLSSGNLVGKIVYHDGSSYLASDPFTVGPSSMLYYSVLLFKLVGLGAGVWKLHMTVLPENASVGPLTMTEMMEITDGPTGISYAGGVFTTVNIVSADGSTPFGDYVSGNARRVTFRKAY
jgi:hypothetical protein